MIVKKDWRAHGDASDPRPTVPQCEARLVAPSARRITLRPLCRALGRQQFGDLSPAAKPEFAQRIFNGVKDEGYFVLFSVLSVANLAGAIWCRPMAVLAARHDAVASSWMGLPRSSGKIGGARV